MGKKKMILIAEDDLKTIVSDAVKTALDTVTKKIAAKCATLSYNNEMFNSMSSHDDDDDDCYCGCGSAGGYGCGNSGYRSSSGCGGGYSSGGC